MSEISPQRVLEEAINLQEHLLTMVEPDDDLVERINNNLEELQDLIKRLYMKGIYSV